MPTRKLIVAVFAIVLVAGVVYAGLIIRRDRVETKTYNVEPTVSELPSRPEATEDKPTVGQSPSKEPDAIQIDISGWNTYVNDQYEFEISYPQGLYLTAKVTSPTLLYRVMVRNYTFIDA